MSNQRTGENGVKYDKVSAIAHKADDEGTTWRDATTKSGYISAADFDKIVVPAQMVGNPHRDLGLA
jgi:fumarate hydratase class II